VGLLGAPREGVEQGDSSNSVDLVAAVEDAYHNNPGVYIAMVQFR